MIIDTANRLSAKMKTVPRVNVFRNIMVNSFQICRSKRLLLLEIALLNLPISGQACTNFTVHGFICPVAIIEYQPTDKNSNRF